MLDDGYDPDKEFTKKLEEADDFLLSLYKQWNLDTFHTVLHDHEKTINLLQLYLQTWILHNAREENWQNVVGVNIYVTQALFLMGYNAAKAEQQLDDEMPDSIKNLDIKGLV